MTNATDALSYLTPDLADSIRSADSPLPVKRPPPWMIRLLNSDQGGRCALCNATLNLGRVDFVIPTEVGGSTQDRDNMALFCSRCVRTRAHRDLLTLSMDVPAALLEKRRALWTNLPHHLLPIGRGRSPAVVRDALLRRADHPRVRYIVDFTPSMVWIGGRTPVGWGVLDHLNVLAEHGPLVRGDLDGVRMWGLPSASAPKALAALIEAGGYLVPLRPCSNSWAAHLVGVAAHRRRAQSPSDTPWPSERAELSTHPRAVADRDATRRRRIRTLIAARDDVTERMGRARDVPVVLAALFTERTGIEQRLADLCCQSRDAS